MSNSCWRCALLNLSSFGRAVCANVLTIMTFGRNAFFTNSFFANMLGLVKHTAHGASNSRNAHCEQPWPLAAPTDSRSGAQRHQSVNDEPAKVYVMLISTCCFEEKTWAMTFLTPPLATERTVGKNDLARLILREVFGNVLQSRTLLVAVLRSFLRRTPSRRAKITPNSPLILQALRKRPTIATSMVNTVFAYFNSVRLGKQ